MNEHLQKMLAASRGLVPDALMLTGAAAVSFGAGQIYAPAGWIAAGGFLLTAGVLAARKAA